VVGVGNVAQGDDGLGVQLAERLADCVVGVPGARSIVLVAGAEPERYVGQLSAGDFATVLFLDVVAMGGAAGSVAILDARGLQARFPQVSTHKLSLGLLARLIEAGGRTRVWLLGVQPATLRAGGRLSAVVSRSVNCLADLLAATLLRQPETLAGPHACRGARERALRSAQCADGIQPTDLVLAP
jgi:hydrogenase maturation protease